MKIILNFSVYPDKSAFLFRLSKIFLVSLTLDLFFASEIAFLVLLGYDLAHLRWYSSHFI